MVLGEVNELVDSKIGSVEDYLKIFFGDRSKRKLIDKSQPPSRPDC